MLARRTLLTTLAGVPLLVGCSAPLPPLRAPVTTPDAQNLLDASAAAHGSAAFAAIRDISVRYAGQWRGLVGTLQPALVDSGFRGGSEERLLLRDGRSAQAYTGPDGRKQVARHTAPGNQGSVRVWFNGTEAPPGEQRDAAALVADGYALFLLGPMLLAGRWTAERSLTMERAAPERITVGGRDLECDVLRIGMTPGFGLSERDDLALYIDCGERLMRRVRFTLNGLDSTRGGVADVDAWGHVAHGGCRWPTRFHEQLLRPLPIPVHDWRLEGLDLDRGLVPGELDGAVLTGRAAPPAASLPTA